MAKKKIRKPLNPTEIEGLEKQLQQEFAKYDLAKQDFEGLRLKKQEEFALQLPKLLSDEELEIVEVGGDVGQTYQIIKNHETAFVDNAVAEQEKILDAFEDDLHQKQGQLDLLKVETAFMSANPDADFEGLIEFMTMKLNQEEIGGLNKEADGDHAKFLTLVHDRFVGTGRKNTKEGDELPTDLSGVAGGSGNVDNGDGGSTEDESDYLKKIGLN